MGDWGREYEAGSAAASGSTERLGRLWRSSSTAGFRTAWEDSAVFNSSSRGLCRLQQPPNRESNHEAILNAHLQTAVFLPTLPVPASSLHCHFHATPFLSTSVH